MKAANINYHESMPSLVYTDLESICSPLFYPETVWHIVMPGQDYPLHQSLIIANMLEVGRNDL